MITLEVRQAAANILVLHQEIARLANARLHSSGAVGAEFGAGAAQEENVALLHHQRSGTFSPSRQEKTSILWELQHH